VNLANSKSSYSFKCTLASWIFQYDYYMQVIITWDNEWRKRNQWLP